MPRNSLWCFSIYLHRWCLIHSKRQDRVCARVCSKGQSPVAMDSITHRHTHAPPVPYGTLWIPSKVRHQAYLATSSCILLSHAQRHVHTRALTHTHTHTHRSPNWPWDPHGLSRSWPGSPGASSSQFLQWSHSQTCTYPAQACGHFDTQLLGHFYLPASLAWYLLAMTHCCTNPHMLGLLALQSHGPL